MTKTLTEKWRKHKLKYKQNYYLFLEDGEEDIQPFIGGFFMSESNEVKEVLATVPDYTEWKQTEEQVQNLQRMVEQECSKRCELEHRMKEAEEALKDFCDDCTLPKCGDCDEDCTGWKAKQYLVRYGVK